MAFSIGFGLSPSITSNKGVRYDTAAAALFARMTVQPSVTRKALDNQLIIDLKAAGWWDICDGFGILGTETEQAGELNWIADQYNLTAVNSVSFASNRGFTGNGSDSYLDTGFNPTTAAGKYSLNSAHLMLFSLTNASAAVYEIGNANARLGVRHNNANAPRFTVNDVGIRNAGISATGLGCFVARRSSSTASRVFQDGAALGTVATTTSTAMGNETFKLLGGVAATFSTKEVFAWSYGSAPTDQQIADMSAILNQYWLDVSTVGL